MQENKITQGEWTLNKAVRTGVNCGRKHIAMVNILPDEQEHEANARLIASAPMLLHCLEQLVERIDHDGGLGDYKGGPSFVMKDARETINKAKGVI